MSMKSYLETWSHKLPVDPLLVFSRARNIHFTTQMAVLRAIEQALPGGKRSPPPSAELIQVLRVESLNVLKEDVKNIRDGVYPIQVLEPEKLKSHLKRLATLVIDGVKASIRRSKKITKEFSEPAQEFLDEIPDYYRRNFHFQTDGYLSKNSAELYDHQVELLFGGTASAMRRTLLKPMKQFFKGSNGAGLKILEISCGTGSFTKSMALTFPKAQITANDLSHPYLKAAQSNLRKFPRIDFVQGPAERLPFADQTFDALVSVYLFHELPLEAREQVLKEAKRVLKPGGFLGIVDSMQMDDKPEYNKLLENFAKDYHEPFFKNYLTHSMGDLIMNSGFESLKSHRAFVSKCWWAQKI